MAEFSKSPCASKIRAAAKGVLTTEQVDDLFRRVDANRGEGLIDDAVRKASKEWASRLEYEAFSKKRTAILNALKTSSMFSQASKFQDPSDYFHFITLGGEKQEIGVRDNAASRRDTLKNDFFSKVYIPLKKRGLFNAFRNGQMDNEIAIALFAKTASHDQIDSISGMRDAIAGLSQEARFIADAIHSQQRRAIEIENSNGAFRGWRNGFVVTQSHDRAKIRAAGRSTYINDIRNFIDIKGTLENLLRVGRVMPEAIPDDVRSKIGIVGASLLDGQLFNEADFFDSLFGVFTTGVRLDSNGGLHASGSGNIAARAEQSRILEFKSPQAQMEYNRKYGAGTLAESLDNQFFNHASTITTLQFFGPSPKENLKRAQRLVLENLRRQYDVAVKEEDAGGRSKRSPSAIQKSIDRASEERVDKMMARYMGELSAPENAALNAVTSKLLVFQRLAKLGAASISSLTDTATHALALQIEGVPIVRAILNPIISPLQYLGNKEAGEALVQIGVGLEGAMGGVFSRFDGDMSHPGQLLNYIQDKFFKVTGLTQLTDSFKTSYVWMQANNLASHAGLRFDSLPPKIKAHLERYNINAGEWDVARKFGVSEASGWKMVHPDLVSKADDAAIRVMLANMGEPSSERAIKQARFGLESKLRNMYLDGADYASVTPDAKTQHSVEWGRPGTVIGEIGRATMQFKAFPIAVVQKTLARHFHAEGVAGLGKVMAGMTIAGIVVQLAKDYIRGRAMPEWDSMSAQDYGKLGMAGFAQSGALGIMSDFIFQQAYLDGHSTTGIVLGPTGETLTKPIELLWKKALNGEDIGDDWIKYARSNAPGANIFWAKPLADHYLWYGLMESANPGTLRRIEEKAKSSGRPYDPNHPLAGLLRPTEAAYSSY